MIRGGSEFVRDLEGFLCGGGGDGETVQDPQVDGALA